MTPVPDVPEVRRPLSHITAPRNWLNDPNGLARHRGRWHVFYQHNPAAPRWGAPWWGHVSSDDLVHWEDHPPALRPRADAPDRDGCWSGCVRVVDDVPTAFYTGVVGEGADRVESVCVATGDDALETWTQHDSPLIAGAPPGIGTGYHRDPFVFGSPGAWRMLIGSGLGAEQGDGGAILHYRSPDLRSWTYEGVLWHRPRGLGPIDTGPLWECPQLVRIGDDDVLIFSVNFEGEAEQLRYSLAAVGRLSEVAFRPRSISRLDFGNVFYAPAVLEDGSGRVLVWGWAQERHERVNVDHAGALALPRVLRLDDSLAKLEPTSEVDALRVATVAVGDVTPAGAAMPDWPATEVLAAVPPESLGLGLHDALGSLLYSILIDRAGRCVHVRSGTSSDGVNAPLSVPPDADLSLRLLVDGSLAELFLNGVSVTTRLYGPVPTRLASLGPGDLKGVQLHRLGRAFAERA